MPLPSGHIVTADEYNMRMLTARKSAEVANNTTTLASDSELFLNPTVAGDYYLYAALWFQSTAAGDFKMTVIGDGTGITSANIRFSLYNSASTLIFGASTVSVDVGDTGFHSLIITGMVMFVTMSGTPKLSVQWAQNTADAGPTKALIGSYVQMQLKQ